MHAREEMKQGHKQSIPWEVEWVFDILIVWKQENIL